MFYFPEVAFGFSLSLMKAVNSGPGETRVLKSGVHEHEPCEKRRLMGHVGTPSLQLRTSNSVLTSTFPLMFQVTIKVGDKFFFAMLKTQLILSRSC